MGAWGTAISSNDTYADAYAEFFDLYDEGLSVSEISIKLISSFSETVGDPDDANNFWFALAKAQWECKELDPELLTRIEGIVESGSDIAAWKRLDATDADLKKRAAALAKFLAKLRSEKPKARNRKKRIIRQPVFDKGECLAFKLANGNYGAAVVLEAVARVGFGMNLVATTRINLPDLPTAADILNAEVLIKNFAAWKGKAEIGWRYDFGFKKEGHLFQTVGTIPIEKAFSPEDHSQGFFFSGNWSSTIEAVDYQLEAEESGHPAPKESIRIKELTDPSRRKFWN